MFCPLSCTQHGIRPKCDPAGCMLYDHNKDKCLIRQALQTYIAEHEVLMVEAHKQLQKEQVMEAFKSPFDTMIYPNDPQDYVRSPLQGGL